MMEIAIEIENIDSSEASALIDELSAELENITGNSGRSSFDNSDIKNPRSIFVIARESGSAVGCGAFRELSDDIAEVKRMYTRKKSCGIGNKILSYLEMQAIEFGYSTIILETRRCNDKAVKFYLNHGYKVINNYGKYVDKPEAVCFEKKL
jgi:N-acetylglutamate synthase-like GNAT family acetyltransferase